MIIHSDVTASVLHASPMQSKLNHPAVLVSIFIVNGDLDDILLYTCSDFAWFWNFEQ